MDQTLKSEDIGWVYELGQITASDPAKMQLLMSALIANHAALVLNVAKQLCIIDDVRVATVGGVAVSLNAEQHRKVLMEINMNRKVEAIKLVRGFTGLGLKEAKDAVEAMEMTASLRR